MPGLIRLGFLIIIQLIASQPLEMFYFLLLVTCCNLRQEPGEESGNSPVKHSSQTLVLGLNIISTLLPFSTGGQSYFQRR